MHRSPKQNSGQKRSKFIKAYNCLKLTDFVQPYTILHNKDTRFRFTFTAMGPRWKIKHSYL